MFPTNMNMLNSSYIYIYEPLDPTLKVFSFQCSLLFSFIFILSRTNTVVSPIVNLSVVGFSLI